MAIWAAILPALLLGSASPAPNLSQPPPVTRRSKLKPALDLRWWIGVDRGHRSCFLAGLAPPTALTSFRAASTSQHRVIATTRRGVWSVERPALVSNFTPERLAADVIAVLDRLDIKRPFLAGHSVADGNSAKSVPAIPKRSLVSSIWMPPTARHFTAPAPTYSIRSQEKYGAT